MFGRFRKNYQKEDGAYMVITALLLTAIIGFIVLAVDQGSWLSQKRTEQNAVDAAAVAAAETYANGGSGDQATAAALNAANQNGIVATASDLVITPDNATNPKRVKAMLTLDADNYFYNNGNTKNKTAIVVTSEAQIYEEQTSGGSFVYNPAIEADNFYWNGSSTKENEITGDIVIGSSGFKMNAPTAVNGNISSDGGVEIYTSYFPITGTINSKQDINFTTPLTVNGNLESCGNITYNGNPGNVINGDVHANGTVSIKNTTVNGSVLAKGKGKTEINNSTIAQNVHSNGDVSIGNITVNGSVLAKGKIELNDGTIVQNDVLSETWTRVIGANSKVNGTFYINEAGAQNDWEKIQSWQKDQMKTTSGSSVKFEPYSGQTVSPVSEVTHTDWIWRWSSLEKTPSISHEVTQGDLVGFANSKQGLEASKAMNNTQMCNCVSLHMSGSDLDPTPVTSIQFYNGYVVQKFVEYLRTSKGVDQTTPIYFPESLTVENGQPAGDPDACIVAKRDINWRSPCDFTGNNGTSFISINGDIIIQVAGNTNINGAVAVLNKDKKLELDGGNNYTSGTATIKGGVISHGNILMTGVWSIIADQNWQKYVPVSGGTKTVKKVKLIS